MLSEGVVSKCHVNVPIFVDSLRGCWVIVLVGRGVIVVGHLVLDDNAVRISTKNVFVAGLWSTVTDSKMKGGLKSLLWGRVGSVAYLNPRKLVVAESG